MYSTLKVYENDVIHVTDFLDIIYHLRPKIP